MEETNFTNQNPPAGQNFNPQGGQITLPNSGAVFARIYWATALKVNRLVAYRITLIPFRDGVGWGRKY